MAVSGAGLLPRARHCPSPNHDERPGNCPVDLLVIHNISLPPGRFGGPWIDDLFLNRLAPSEDPYFAEICRMRVSSHLLIRRDGELVQYVPLDRRAWHAGESSYEGRCTCNDFSVGIELEGTDEIPYTDAQYRVLTATTLEIMARFPGIRPDRIAGHNEIAPGRKSDPGASFDWRRYRQALTPRLDNA